MLRNYRTHGVQSALDLMSVRSPPLLTLVEYLMKRLLKTLLKTLTDEDNNSIITYEANGEISCKKKMQVTLPCDQTFACSAIWWPNLFLIQVAPPVDQISI